MPTTPAPVEKIHLITAEDAQADGDDRSTRVVDCTMDDACPYCTPETRAELAAERARERTAALATQVQGWLEEQARYAREELTDERARLTKAAASPDFNLSAIATQTSRIATSTGLVDAYEAAARALAETDPATALYLAATNALHPTGGVYGSRTGSQQEAYTEGVRVASGTVLSALRALMGP